MVIVQCHKSRVRPSYKIHVEFRLHFMHHQELKWDALTDNEPQKPEIKWFRLTMNCVFQKNALVCGTTSWSLLQTIPHSQYVPVLERNISVSYTSKMMTVTDRRGEK